MLVFNTKHILLPLFERKFPSKKGHIFQNSKTLLQSKALLAAIDTAPNSISIVTFYFLDK